MCVLYISNKTVFLSLFSEQKTVFVDEGMILEQLRMGGEIFLYLLEPNDENIQSELLYT